MIPRERGITHLTACLARTETNSRRLSCWQGQGAIENELQFGFFIEDHVLSEPGGQQKSGDSGRPPRQPPLLSSRRSSLR